MSICLNICNSLCIPDLYYQQTHHSSLNQVANEILIQNVKDENRDLKITSFCNYFS